MQELCCLENKCCQYNNTFNQYTNTVLSGSGAATLSSSLGYMLDGGEGAFYRGVLNFARLNVQTGVSFTSIPEKIPDHYGSKSNENVVLRICFGPMNQLQFKIYWVIIWWLWASKQLNCFRFKINVVDEEVTDYILFVCITYIFYIN